MMRVFALGLAIILCLLFVLPSTSYASGFAIKQYFKSAGSQPTFETISSQIYVVLRTFGLILAVCILVTIAISYMIATPNKRAILKERLIYYVAGVVFLIGGIGFLGTYQRIAEEIKSEFGGSASGSNAYNPTGSEMGSGYTNQDGQWVYYDTTIQSIKESTDIPWNDIKKMDYNSLKDYVNALDKNVREFKKMIEKQGSSISSGEQETLDRAETRLKNAYDRLVELKTLQSGN